MVCLFHYSASNRRCLRTEIFHFDCLLLSALFTKDFDAIVIPVIDLIFTRDGKMAELKYLKSYPIMEFESNVYAGNLVMD